jgi:hypothetical protein
VVNEVEMRCQPLKEAFAKTNKPLGWYFAGRLGWIATDQFECFKKSAEGGCSWGQVAYAQYFGSGILFKKDLKVYLEWLEKAASQNNPQAMERLGGWFRVHGSDKERAASYFRAGAELGSRNSMYRLWKMLTKGDGCDKDLRFAAIWAAKMEEHFVVYWDTLRDARLVLQKGTTEDFECDFDHLCYALGWGAYWHNYGGADWEAKSVADKSFGNACLDYYCEAVTLQQESIFTFLLCWNSVVGVKDVGLMVAKMVWEERGENLVKDFDGRAEISE